MRTARGSIPHLAGSVLESTPALRGVLNCAGALPLLPDAAGQRAPPVRHLDVDVVRPDPGVTDQSLQGGRPDLVVAAPGSIGRRATCTLRLARLPVPRIRRPARS